MESTGGEPDMLDPTRIRLARELSGLSKVALAKQIGVTARRIHTFETEGAPSSRAESLSAVLGVLPNFFSLAETHQLSPDAGFFRALRRATSAQRASARAAASIGTLVYDFITERFVLPQQVLPDADGDAPASAAALLRAMWGRGPEPLPNLIQLAEAHGVRVLSLPPSARAVDAFSFILNGQAFAFLSTEKTAERTRFDLAHELGHLIMHTRHPVEPDQTTEELAPEPFGRDLEAEANRFAAELLMPAAEIRAAAGPAPAVSDVLALKTRYRVSAIAMARRFHDLELSSEWAYRQNLVELGKLGYRTDEPGGMSRERSRVFTHVFTHLRNKGVSSKEVADELGVPVELLHQLTFSQLPIAVAGDAVRSAGPRPALKLIDGGA